MTIALTAFVVTLLSAYAVYFISSFKTKDKEEFENPFLCSEEELKSDPLHVLVAAHDVLDLINSSPSKVAFISTPSCEAQPIPIRKWTPEELREISEPIAEEKEVERRIISKKNKRDLAMAIIDIFYIRAHEKAAKGENMLTIKLQRFISFKMPLAGRYLRRMGFDVTYFPPYFDSSIGHYSTPKLEISW